MRVLILHTGTLGELLYSTALIRGLKVQLDAYVVFLTTSEGKAAIEENPYVDEFFVFSIENFKQLRLYSFEYIIDLDNTTRSWFLAAVLKGKVLRFNTQKFFSFLLVKFKIDKFPTRNLTEQYLDTVRHLGLKDDEMRLDYFIPYKYEVPIQWLPHPFQKNYVVFCIKVSYKTRQLPLSKMIEVCDRINKPVILLGDAGDAETGNSIEIFFSKNGSVPYEEGLKALNKKTLVYNACGKFNFQQQASLIKKASYVFTFDNDYIPLASAFGRETFCIYGNTVLSFGRYPFQTRFTILENNKLTCRPCSTKGYKKCPLGHFKCMNEINLDFYLT
jgi:ADP-heptose:LPS heptosyltransferase